MGNDDDEKNGFSPFPQMGDDGGGNKDVKGHSNRGGGGFSFGGFDFSQLKSANRVYNIHGITYFLIMMLVYGLFHLLADNLNNYGDIFNDVKSVVLSIIMVIIFTLLYLAIDTWLLGNSVDLRYTFSKYATYSLWGLLFGAIWFLIFVIAYVTNSFGMSGVATNFANLTLSGKLLIHLMDIWMKLVPLFIFLFQRGAEFKARMVSGFGYLITLGICVLVFMGIGHFFPNPAVTVDANGGQPQFQSTPVKQYHRQLTGNHIMENVLSNPKNVVLTDADDKNNADLALAYAQYTMRYEQMTLAQVFQHLKKNGFSANAINKVGPQISLSLSHEASNK